MEFGRQFRFRDLPIKIDAAQHSSFYHSIDTVPCPIKRTLCQCRLKGSPLPLQEEIFIKQIRIAEEVKKPIIIHCVKCFNELISIKKIIRPKVPMIVHGFNNNLTIAQMLLERGFYISLGAAILQENSNAAQLLTQIPLEKLFLETDDAKRLIFKKFIKKHLFC
ncbi:MAG: TatD family hydrolase [Emticicia sp.]|nr:TatD family hydrolase [Emticicia sp.]